MSFNSGFMSERFGRIEQLYQEALERPEGERASFLEQACSGDEELRREVESLLACQSEAEDFIESPALEVAAKEMARDEASKAAKTMAGQSLSHYRIAEKIGEGGMGVVYKARDSHLDRFVALKILPPEKVADSDRKRRFVQEAKAASALNHPNIITIHDIAQHDGTHFIAMEYVEGKTLDRLIGRRGLPLGKALR